VLDLNSKTGKKQVNQYYYQHENMLTPMPRKSSLQSFPDNNVSFLVAKGVSDDVLLDVFESVVNSKSRLSLRAVKKRSSVVGKVCHKVNQYLDCGVTLKACTNDGVMLRNGRLLRFDNAWAHADCQLTLASRNSDNKKFVIFAWRNTKHLGDSGNFRPGLQ